VSAPVPHSLAAELVLASANARCLAGVLAACPGSDPAAQGGTIHGSKATGEPPLMLSFSVREAIRDAVAAFVPKGGEVPLASPATCEAILAAIDSRRHKSSQ
jgi:xanthine dehydrogenase molybdopterin-binding subunit B